MADKGTASFPAMLLVMTKCGASGGDCSDDNDVSAGVAGVLANSSGVRIMGHRAFDRTMCFVVAASVSKAGRS